MTNNENLKTWDGLLKAPLTGRNAKPREQGISFISDKGLSVQEARQLAETAGDYIDRVKMAFGTTLLLKKSIVREKILVYTSAGIEVNPGGTCTELAFSQGVYEEYLKQAKEIGFTTIEVSDGTIDVTDKEREYMITAALKAGFKVVSEVGKKDTTKQLALEEVIRQIKRDLEYGVSKVTIESRGSAKGIGVHDESGNIKGDYVDQITTAVDVEILIWEAPSKDSQEYFIKRFGNNVNLGNIQPQDVIALEGLRQGVRGDTFRLTL